MKKQPLQQKIKEKIRDEEASVWIVPTGFFACVVLVCFGFIWFYFGDPLDSSVPVPSTDSKIHPIEVGGTLFAIPENYTRYPMSRQRRLQERVELHALLPDLEPYTDANKGEFLRIDKNTPLVLITIAAHSGGLAPTRIFEKIYRPHFGPNDQSYTADGLTAYPFKDASPYAGRELWRVSSKNADEQRQFMCDKPTHENPTCESRFKISKTGQVSYIFKRSFLPHWKKIDTEIRNFVDSLRAASLNLHRN